MKKTLIFGGVLLIFTAIFMLPFIHAMPAEFTEDIIEPIQHSLEEDFYVIAYNTDYRATTQDMIRDSLDVQGYVADDHYIVYATVASIERLMAEGYVDSYESYVAPAIPFDIPFSTDLYHVILFPAANVDELTETFSTLDNVDVYGRYDQQFIVETDKDTAEELLTLKGVEAIEPRPDVELFNDKSNVVSGVPSVRKNFGLYGEGQIIAITDSGLDTGKNDASMHDDIEGRILAIQDVPWLCPTNCISANGLDFSSHGTHVTGTALGNGKLSGSDPKGSKYDNSFAGVAPEAKLVFQSGGLYNTVSNRYYFMPDFPDDVKQWKPAYDLGARIHSNSFGVKGNYGKYSSWSRDLDRFTQTYKSYNILFAAGNAPGPNNVAIPSTAKNSISVGGVWRDNPNKQAYAQGPTDDGRFKPDILAPAIGDPNKALGIVSTKSSKQQPYPIGCQNGPNPHYCEQAGTSMATPHVAGLTALIREHYVKQRSYKTPSAALIKATLLNGAEDIGYGIPSKEAGWGRANIEKSLPLKHDDLYFVDESNFLTTGKKKVYNVYVGKNKPFRATLVWTDYSASLTSTKKLVSDLDLVVVDANNKKFNGNDLSHPFDNFSDRLNNVERVEIPNPAEGVYTIEVSAYNAPIGGQDFALVISHDGNHKFIPAVAICITSKGRPC